MVQRNQGMCEILGGCIAKGVEVEEEGRKNEPNTALILMANLVCDCIIDTSSNSKVLDTVGGDGSPGEGSSSQVHGTVAGSA
eukprot:g33607.t1